MPGDVGAMLLRLFALFRDPFDLPIPITGEQRADQQDRAERDSELDNQAQRLHVGKLVRHQIPRDRGQLDGVDAEDIERLPADALDASGEHVVESALDTQEKGQ